MAGPFAYSRDADVAASARERLDQAASAVAAMEAARRTVLAELIGLWPTSAWLAAGATSAKAWPLAYTHLSDREALRLEQIAGLCAAHPALADAVVNGSLTLRRVERLNRAVTRDRAPFLGEVLDTFLDLNANTTDEQAFDEALAYWAERVDEQLPLRRAHTHSLTLTPALFGGGQIHGHLAPVAFETVKTAIDAWTQDPDPQDAPYQRTLSERQADALDDLAQFALTHDPDHTDPDDDEDVVDDDGEGEGFDWDDLRAEDTFDGAYPGDEFDEALAILDNQSDNAHESESDAEGEGEGRLDPLVLLRRRLRRAEKHRRRRLRRRTRMRSGVTANIHLDLRLLAGLRDIDDLDDLILRGEGWNLTRAAARTSATPPRSTCGTGLCASGVRPCRTCQRRLAQASGALERSSQRHGHCVFPSCTRPPRHCDAHHLHPRGHGGPTGWTTAPCCAGSTTA